MKSKYRSYGILALVVIGIIIISGCVQQQKFVCWNGEKVQDESQCSEKPTLSKDDMSIDVHWSNEYRLPCSEYNKEEGRIWLSIEYDRTLKEKTYDYRCIVNVDDEQQQYALGGGPIERGTPITGYRKDILIQGANVFEDHTVELCCFLGEYTGKKDSKGNDLYEPLTDEVCVTDTLSSLC